MPPSRTGDAEIDHRLVAPETLAEPGDGFLESAQVEQPGAAGAVRPPARLAQIINAGPEKLAGHVVVVPHGRPRG